jgi:hypothetical protein
MLYDCPTRACAIERGLLHCGECAEYPCDVLNGFYNDGKPHHAQARLNMLEIIKIGADEWIDNKKN